MEIDGIGLASLDDAPGTDEKIEQLSLDGLQSLWLSRSDITDVALDRLATASSLSKLHLRSTRITDDGLRHMAELKELYPGITIDLRGSRVTMAGVAQFLKSLPEPEFPVEARLHVDEGSISHEVMLFDGSPVTDAQIECFRGLTGFYRVNLSKTRITDAGLRVVADFVHLAYLDVSGTRITDLGLEHLRGLTQLQSLDLRNTRVTDEGVNRLQQVLPKCKIEH